MPEKELPPLPLHLEKHPSHPERNFQIAHTLHYEWGSLALTEGFSDFSQMLPLTPPRQVPPERESYVRNEYPVLNIVLSTLDEVGLESPYPPEEGFTHAQVSFYRQGIEMVIATSISWNDVREDLTEEMLDSLEAFFGGGKTREEIIKEGIGPNGESVEEYLAQVTTEAYVKRILTQLLEPLIVRTATEWHALASDERDFLEEFTRKGVLTALGATGLTAAGITSWGSVPEIFKLGILSSGYMLLLMSMNHRFRSLLQQRQALSRAADQNGEVMGTKLILDIYRDFSREEFRRRIDPSIEDLGQ